jgi:DNA-binding transcriptional LysR family regulator
VKWDDRVGFRLRLRDWHILLTVAQLGSMGKAAARLAVSQPVVSKAVSDLERTLGVRLLDRSPRGVEPTVHGRAFIDRGNAVFDEIRQGVKDLEFLSDPAAGELRIGTTTALADGFVLATTEQLSRQYPRLKFHVVTGDSVALYRELRERQVELVMTRMFTPVQQTRMQVEILFEDPLVVVCSTRSRWAKRRIIKLKELVDEPWTWPPPETPFGAAVVEAFRLNGVAPPPAIVHTGAANMRMGLVRGGRFLTILPASVLQFPIRQSGLNVLPIALPSTRKPTGLVTLKNRSLSPAAQLFVECARRLAKQVARQSS